MPNRIQSKLFRRKDGKYLIYIAKGLTEDSMFPFPLLNGKSLKVVVSFCIGTKRLEIEPLKEGGEPIARAGDIATKVSVQPRPWTPLKTLRSDTE